MLNLDELNPTQRAAVEWTEGPLLILAGPGSGKTRVLTYRIAYILEQELAKPWEILAITFTNRAAGEMKERLGRLVGPAGEDIWCSTFHSMCVKILRRDIDKLGYSRNFSIYDQTDQKRLMQKIYKEFDEGAEKLAHPAMVAELISRAKNTEEDYTALGGPGAGGEIIHRACQRYQEELQKASALDFDDLLLKTLELFKMYPDVLKKYQDKFKYIHVDEYQDVNSVQYKLVSLISQHRRNLMVIGDDFQSIYRWRCADITNILNFEKDYPDALVVKLEENYRSTPNIVKIANQLIKQNTRQKEKNLFTNNPEGAKVKGFIAKDDREEGILIAREIETLRRQEGYSYDDFAIFYRTNGQSRALEEAFMRRGIPYKLLGGTRFFDRMEIKDFMSYLRFLTNPRDNLAVQRILNVPKRGLGKTTEEKIDKFAKQKGITFFEAIERGDEIRFNEGTVRKLGSFLADIQALRKKMDSGSISEQIEAILNRTGMLRQYEEEGSEDSLTRAENLKEFLSVTHEYTGTHPNATLEEFVEWLTLRTDLDEEAEETEPHVVLMTIHTSKGLEYPVVFITGLEDNLLPHVNSLDNLPELEEERRLFYVAITRAKRRLFISRCVQRMHFGKIQRYKPSRFLQELPQQELDAHESFASGCLNGTSSSVVSGERHIHGGFSSKKADSPPATSTAKNIPILNTGDSVRHKKFGVGKVLSVDGDKVEIRFQDGLQKKLLLGYAPLEKI